jgi:hypothetical protein
MASIAQPASGYIVRPFRYSAVHNAKCPAMTRATLVSVSPVDSTAVV